MNSVSDDVYAGLPLSKDELILSLRELSRESNNDEVADVLETTIKEDRANKLITFYCMLLNYTLEDQQNIIFKSESSRGKTYIALEIARFFPQEDVVRFMRVSPKAFYHEYGVYDKERRVITVSLDQKILIFLDQQRADLLKELRPLLSHDQRILRCEITDRRRRGGHLTKTVEIIGFPTVVFCTAQAHLTDQELTRAFILSPEATSEKLDLSLRLQLERLSDPFKFKEWLENDPKRVWLAKRVATVKHAHIRHILIPDKLKYEIYEHFREDHPYLAPRYTRDLPRLIALIKAHALFNYSNREVVERPIGKCIKVNREDVLEGYQLYNEIAEANELGLTPETYEIWTNIISPRITGIGFLKRELSRWHFQTYHRNLSNRRLNMIIDELIATGLIYEEIDPDDRRKKRYYPTAIMESGEKSV